jgi:hypothetical protein
MPALQLVAPREVPMPTMSISRRGDGRSVLPLDKRSFI